MSARLNWRAERQIGDGEMLLLPIGSRSLATPAQVKQAKSKLASWVGGWIVSEGSTRTGNWRCGSLSQAPSRVRSSEACGAAGAGAPRSESQGASMTSAGRAYGAMKSAQEPSLC